MSIPSEGITIYHPEDWQEVPGVYSNARMLGKIFSPDTGRALKEGANGANTASITVVVEHRGSREIALARLYEIASEEKVQAQFLQIGGWPAIQRRHAVTLPGKGEDDLEPRGDTEPQRLIKVTTAIAADRKVIRMEGALPLGAAASVAEEIEAIGRAIVIARIDPSLAASSEATGKARTSARFSPLLAAPHSSAPAWSARSTAEGDFTEAASRSESEIAVSTDGKICRDSRAEFFQRVHRWRPDLQRPRAHSGR